MSLKERIHAIETFLNNLQNRRSAIIQILMWEIGKNYNDAASEFDRTIEFCKKVIGVLHVDPEYAGVWQTIGSTKALVRRAAIGIILALGPYNYPLNETYATIIPALLMGNIVLMKIPTVGGLVHFLTSKSKVPHVGVDCSVRRKRVKMALAVESIVLSCHAHSTVV
jgi:glyceraldehyde-3-phosphate dehydrogenase (NADP+)